MAVAGALLLILLAIVVFHWWSPWWLPETASNWSIFDQAFNLTLWITGLFFVVIYLFLVYTLLRFRARSDSTPGSQAPEPIGASPGRKTEWSLIIITTIGIVVMLAPGLWLYTKYVTHPEPDLSLEVVGQQWHWSFRYPGADGKLGATQPDLISVQNPFGLRADDSAAQDDIIVQGPLIKLPVDSVVDLQMRSRDVLHSFYVPEFRLKMDLVPGRLSSLWFTPTQLGQFPILCTEYCGLAHGRMRGEVHVVSQQEFEQWLSQQAAFQQLGRSEQIQEGP